MWSPCVKSLDAFVSPGHTQGCRDVEPLRRKPQCCRVAEPLRQRPLLQPLLLEHCMKPGKKARPQGHSPHHCSCAQGCRTAKGCGALTSQFPPQKDLTNTGPQGCERMSIEALALRDPGLAAKKSPSGTCNQTCDSAVFFTSIAFFTLIVSFIQVQINGFSRAVSCGDHGVGDIGLKSCICTR